MGGGGPYEHLCHDKNSAWAVGAWLCLKLLREWREHAQVSKVLDVIVASPLRRVPRHRQHVLEHFTLARLLVGVLLTALLSVVLALPLRPDLRGPALELPATLSTLSEPRSPVGQTGVGVSTR